MVCLTQKGQDLYFNYKIIEKIFSLFINDEYINILYFGSSDQKKVVSNSLLSSTCSNIANEFIEILTMSNKIKVKIKLNFISI